MSKKSNDTRKTFIPKEQGSLPRILLLDYDDKTEEVLRGNKFQVFSGTSGFKNGKREFPIDSSEIEIVFWDLSQCDFTKYHDDGFGNIMSVYSSEPRRGQSICSTKKNILGVAGKSTGKYFDQIRNKGGFICIFLGEKYIDNKKLSGFLGFHQGKLFSLSTRYNNRVELIKNEGDIYYEFFNRFFDEDKIKRIIHWESNFVGVKFYFNDEDKNHYAVDWGDILISPQPNKLTDATLYLLQEILPNTCSADIYPDLHKYKWIQDIKSGGFESSDIAMIGQKLAKLETEYVKKTKELQNRLEEIEESESYLYELLYKDDSNLFDEGSKLKDVVKKVLEEILEFSDVIDMDSERTKLGLALKEDLRINDNVFIEVKGTEKGAKANWTKDLASHVNDYCCIAKKDINSLKQILVFNHERKKNPLERSEPYEDNPELKESCKSTNKLLIPVFELFKLVFDARNKKIKKEEARNLILNSSGVFSYKSQ